MQPLLLLHGAIGAKDQLQPLADELAADFIIHTINFPGHGGEEMPAAFSIQLFAEQVLQYLRQNNITRVNIFGYSMGGYVALYLAKHHPWYVDRIITLATKFHWDEDIAAKEVKMLDPEIIRGKIPAFAKQLEERHLPNSWTDVLDKTKTMLLEMGKQNPLTLTDYTSINNDCLLLLGDKDKMVTREETEAVQQQLPHAHFELLADTPHPIELVNTNALGDLLRSFLF